MSIFNIVELIDNSGKSGFNQSCRFGYLVEGHSVYCHNESWEGSPRKCDYTWSSGGQYKDEDCEGFEKNPKLKSGK